MFLSQFENVMATLNYFTAFSIVESYKKFIFKKYSIEKVVVSGGGAFNKVLMDHLQALLNPIPVVDSQCLGMPVQSKEPIAFAFFAWQTLKGKINHLPQTTGASRSMILGKITPGKNFMRLFTVLISLFLLSNISVWAKVQLGIDVLQSQGFEMLQGKRVGLITNHTGKNNRGKSTIDILFNAPGGKLVALFSPEHGIRGKAEHGAIITDSIDQKTQLPIFSLYGKNKRPTSEMLKNIDVLVFDMQDIGTRFYTYTTTLAYALEEASKHSIEFIVLDRPNPILGSVIEGEILEPQIQHFTAYLNVPVRHGLTVGEIAQWHNLKKELNAKLRVVPMKNWKREMRWFETGLNFNPTSPNIRTVNAALLYSGIGGFEATNISVGRGTRKPFEVIGAPWIDSEVVMERLKFLNLEEFKFSKILFQPKEDLYEKEVCHGIQIEIKDSEQARPVELFIYLLTLLIELYPEEMQVKWEEMLRIVGSEKINYLLQQKVSAEEIIQIIRDGSNTFRESRKKILLYK